MGKNWWIRFGCFLTGYNYNILLQSSEVSHKLVKKYTAAILIVGILWSLISFQFAREYLDLGLIGSIVASVIGVIIIVQIERQIILAVKPKPMLKWSRRILAVVMAILGAVITDSIVFEEDIKRQREEDLGAEIQQVVESRSTEIKRQIEELDGQYAMRDSARLELLLELEKKPTIKLPSSRVISQKVQKQVFDSTLRTYVRMPVDTLIRVFENESQPNPKIKLLENVDFELSKIRDSRKERSDRLLLLQEDVSSELRENQGFLTELIALTKILKREPWAFVFWLLLFVFVLMLELLVLAAKASAEDTDYDKIILHQKETRIKTLVNL